MQILDINAKPIEACVRLPLNRAFYLSLTTIYRNPEMRVFQTLTGVKDEDVTHVFFPDGAPYPSLENIAKAYTLFQEASHLAGN